MTGRAADSANALKPGELRLDRLLGRQVLGRNNRPVGRIEEFRAEMRGTGCVVTEFMIGFGGLLERLGVGVKLLLGRKTGGYIARWDQIDFTNPQRPRLTCLVEELRKI